MQMIQVISETKAVSVIRKKGTEEQRHRITRTVGCLSTETKTGIFLRTLMGLDLLEVNVYFLDKSSLKVFQCKTVLSVLL